MYKNIVLKLSGEALKGDDYFLSHEKLHTFCADIKSVYKKNIKLSIVVGGGNIFRGGNEGSLKLLRSTGDNIGMLSTVFNALCLRDYLVASEVKATVLSSIEMNKICEFYTAEKAIKLQEENNIIIFAAGIANPYFSTDTCAIIRALELGADIVLKGTQVDGVYNKDPRKHKDASRYDSISHKEIITRNLEVIDLAAIALAHKYSLPIAIFNIHEANSIQNVIKDPLKSTIIS